MLKLFNGGNGIFYVLWGIWGAVRPIDSAKLMGWDHNSLLGLNELRATWAAFAALGSEFYGAFIAILIKGR